MSKHSWGCYVFYPNPNAYKMVIYNFNAACYAIDLKQHEFLNGAFAVLDYEQVREKNFTSLPSVYPSHEDNNFPIEIANKSTPPRSTTPSTSRYLVSTPLALELSSVSQQLPRHSPKDSSVSSLSMPSPLRVYGR